MLRSSNSFNNIKDFKVLFKSEAHEVLYMDESSIELTILNYKKGNCCKCAIYSVTTLYSLVMFHFSSSGQLTLLQLSLINLTFSIFMLCLLGTIFMIGNYTLENKTKIVANVSTKLHIFYHLCCLPIRIICECGALILLL